MKKQLERSFLLITLLALLYLAYNLYSSYQFKHNDISVKYKEQILAKEQEVLNLMQKHYGVRLNIPLIVTDKFQGRLYGLTAYKDGEIKIYLNKKVMRESFEYMLESVIAHEYAHALIFHFGMYDKKSGGHSPEWLLACQKLGGKKCGQYVNTQDVVMGKLPF